MKEIIEQLKKMQDIKYLDFQSKLIPTVPKNTIIGVRTPALKKYAKELLQNGKSEKFILELPHKYFDENQLHAFIISEINDYNDCIWKLNKFLPYIDNWATCDQLSPKCFKKNQDKILRNINTWTKSKKAYIIRFGIKMLMQYFLDENFDSKYLKLVADIRYGKKRVSDELYSVKNDPDKYYVEMMRAWFFATALAKQYKETLPYVKGKELQKWTRNKAIQKALESYRLSNKEKERLKMIK